MSLQDPACTRRLVVAGALAAVLHAPLARALTLGEEEFGTVRRTTSGTLKSVDAAQRRIVVRTDQGDFAFRLDKKVDNVEQLKAGDPVKVDYVAALALTLRRGGAEVKKRAEADAARNPGSGTPGAAARVTIVAEVLEIDRPNKIVKLKASEGRVGDFRVDDPARLSGVKVGDKVVAVVYEAVAVGVVPSSR